MKTKLSLQEKLRDLRDERKLTLAQVTEETGIPTPTLQRIESSEDIRAGYQDVATLAIFYEVSTDYLFGLTDNLQHRNTEIDTLSLSDSAIDVLQSGKVNNRLVSELIANPDFIELSRAMEVYVDRKIQLQINSLNAIYQFAEKTLEEEVGDKLDNEVRSFLSQAQINEDDYLRFRISESFNQVMKNLFEAHKEDSFAEQSDISQEFKEIIEIYKHTKKNPNYKEERRQLYVLGKILKMNINQLTDTEANIMCKALYEKSGIVREFEAKNRLKKRK